MVSLFPGFKKSIAAVCIIVCSIHTQAQKKYPSLLWEITGNGLSKPSYLYGTMHVSSKLAYHLSDSFFVAISNVNTVGLESNPDQWLKNMKDIGLLEQLNNPNTYNNADFYKEAFKLETPNNKKYRDILSNDPDIINNLLYRNNSNKNDHEESTYIDLFIYKAGSKLNKTIVSLEDFKTSLVMATKGTTPGLNENSYENKMKIDYIKVQNQINDAYRSGDLDAIDSLSQLTYTTKNTQKYLIEDRNTILAHNIDSICRTGSLFAGIGAAHLPGKNGVIEMLIKMGYKVRPVSNVATKKGTKQKEKIEAIVKKWTANKQYAKDSLFSYDLYETPVNVANLKGYSFFLTADMANGSYYTISRLLTYAPINNYTIEKQILKLDSLLYESIPGKIISKKEFITPTGIKGLDIFNKTKRGDLQRYQIFFTSTELIVFKMSGKGDYVNGTEANRFFTSIKFYPKKEEIISSYSPPTKGFSIAVPNSYQYINNKKTGLQGLSEELFAFNQSSNTSIGVMHYFYHDFNYLEEDTFELNLLSKHTLKNFNYNSNVTSELSREQNLSCINFSGQNLELNKTMYAKLFIKGVHYYLVYCLVNSNSPKPSDVLNSFKIIDFKHINELKMITDHDFAFTVVDEMVPEDRNQLQEALADFYAEMQKEKDKNIISNSFSYESKSKTYYSPSSGEHINIDYEKYNDYDYRDSSAFWTDIEKYIRNNTSFIVKKPALTKNKDTQIFDVILKDTASSNTIKRKYVLKDGLLFCLSAVCDSSIGTTGWTESFFKSFKHKDTTISKPIFVNKTNSLLKDLCSSDTTLKYAAKQSLISTAIDKKFSKSIVEFLKSPEFLKLEEDSRASLIVNAGTLEDETIIPVFKNLYNYYEDSSYMQICLIKGLGFLKTKNSYNTIFELLKNKTPLTGSESNINDVFSPLYDSLELCSNFFPSLFTLSSFEEYKTPVYTLFSDLVIRNKLASAKYQTQVPSLLVEANNELKRYNSSSKANKNNQNSYDAEEEANRLAEYLSNMITETTTDTKNSFPNYSNMIENHAATLAPFYQTNSGVKQFFDKLFKIKNEQVLLNIYLIAAKNKITINDTVWKYFSNNKKTKLKTYNELTKLNLLNHFDKTKLSQEEFCKTQIESNIEFENIDYDNNAALKQKTKPDSLSFTRKEYVKNNKEEGYMYFFDRINSETKEKSIAYAYVKKQKEDKVTTQIELVDVNRVIDIGKTAEEIIKDICAEFYYKHRLRYIPENSYYQNNNYYGDY